MRKPVPHVERSSGRPPSRIVRFAAGWSWLTPWWWVYLPFVLVSGAFIVLYFGNWGAHDVNYAVIRLVSSGAIGIFVLDQSRHKAFYLRRARQCHPKMSRLRKTLGWSSATLAVLAMVVALAQLIAGNNDGSRSFAVVGAVFAAISIYLLKCRGQRLRT